MALSKKDVEIIKNIVQEFSDGETNSTPRNDLKNLAEYVKELVHPLDKQIIEQLLKAIDKQVEINNQVNKELEQLLETLSGLNKKFSNGLGSDIKNTAGNVEKIYNDIVTKEGYLPKAINKLFYLWVPLIGILIGFIVQLIKFYN